MVCFFFFPVVFFGVGFFGGLFEKTLRGNEFLEKAWSWTFCCCKQEKEVLAKDVSSMLYFFDY